MKNVYFSDVFYKALEKAGFSQAKFANEVGTVGPFINQILKKRAKPPLDRIDAWADRLHLTGPERAEFLLLARLEHTPTELHDLLRTRAEADRILDANDHADALRAQRNEGPSLVRELTFRLGDCIVRGAAEIIRYGQPLRDRLVRGLPIVVPLAGEVGCDDTGSIGAIDLTNPESLQHLPAKAGAVRFVGIRKPSRRDSHVHVIADDPSPTNLRHEQVIYSHRDGDTGTGYAALNPDGTWTITDGALPIITCLASDITLRRIYAPLTDALGQPVTVQTYQRELAHHRTANSPPTDRSELDRLRTELDRLHADLANARAANAMLAEELVISRATGRLPAPIDGAKSAAEIA